MQVGLEPKNLENRLLNETLNKILLFLAKSSFLRKHILYNIGIKLLLTDYLLVLSKNRVNIILFEHFLLKK